MKSLSIKVIYNRRNQKLSNEDKAPVNIEVYLGGENGFRKFLPTGIKIEPQFWNDKKSIVLDTHPNASQHNKIIRDIVSSIEDYNYTLQANKQTLTAELLNDFIAPTASNPKSFLDFVSTEIDPALKRGTRKEHIYTYNLLKEFRNEILFSDINYSFVQDFDRYMRSEKGLMQNTIHKHHAHIKRFIRLASFKELYDESKSPYKKFTSKKEKSDRISLSIEELKMIEVVDTIAYPELIQVKDMFLFACYTGLRYSDMITLERKHIVDDADGLCIVKKMEKVPKPVTLPLALLFKGKPLEILNKYLPNTTTTIFPTYTNQHTNRLLKVIAGIAKTPMRLTFHIARHTFGSMMADLTQNPYLIMDLMGHADIKTSMIYIHRSQERINKQLRDVKWE
jgi:integrase